jgi:hypothetical protein
MKNYIFIVYYNVYRKVLVNIENDDWHNVRDTVRENVWEIVRNNVYDKVWDNYKLFNYNSLQQYKNNI